MIFYIKRPSLPSFRYDHVWIHKRQGLNVLVSIEIQFAMLILRGTSKTKFWFNFFLNRYRVLMRTDGIENLGGMQWELLASLFIAWLIIYLILGKGLSQNGKVSWVIFSKVSAFIQPDYSVEIDAPCCCHPHYPFLKSWEKDPKDRVSLDSFFQDLFNGVYRSYSICTTGCIYECTICMYDIYPPCSIQLYRVIESKWQFTFSQVSLSSFLSDPGNSQSKVGIRTNYEKPLCRLKRRNH